ncbi:hypothetical protein HGB07_05060, partial [Candidatus Roizmanbacteria bacterium]|nr:hypothetical protein [Candidatus Roizmanbacteria bacterium]
QVPPTYILLLGDASQTLSADDIVPTMSLQTLAYGAAAADVWFTMVDGTDESGQLDLLPEMQISRVPARSPGDIKIYLDKLKIYESKTGSNTGLWKNTLVMVGGETGRESNGSTGVRRDVFITQEDGLIDEYINRNYFIKRLNTNLGRNAASGNPTDLFKGTKTDMQQILNNGCLIANFMGHGGGATWSDSQILDISGVDELNNGSTLPFFLSLTCFTGAFDEPRFFSQGGTLSEKLLLTKGKGGIATIGSSSVGWLINDNIMAQSIWKFVLSEEYQGLSIADMLFRAKIEYYLNNIYQWEQAPSMIYQYGVFGDPALRLAIPKEKNSSGDPVISWNLVSYIGNVGDTLKIKATVDGITTGIGYGQLSDTQNLDLALNSQVSFVIQNGKFYQSRNGHLSDTLMVPIPQPIAITPTNVQNFNGGQFKAYVQGTGTDAGKDANGHITFSTSGAVIYSLEASRKIETAIKLPVSFKVGVDSKETITSVGVAVKLESPKDGLTYGEVSGWNYRVLSATLVSKGIYATQDSIPSSLMTKGTRVTYYSYAITASGKYSNTTAKTVVVGELPDVAVYKKSQSGILQFYDNSSIGFYTENNSVVIGTEVYNWSTVDASKVIVMFYQNSITNGDPKRSTKPTLVSNTVIGRDTLSIPAGQKVLATIPVPASFKLSSTYQIGVRAYLDSTGGNFEQSYENNLSNQQSVIYNILKVENNSKQTVSLDTDVTLTYEANTFSKPGFVKVTKVEGPSITSQPDNQFMRFSSQRNGTVVDENYYAYRIQAINNDLTLSKPIKITMKYDGKDPFLVNFPSRRERVAGYYLGENIQRWLKLSAQTKPDTTTVEMESDSLGAFCVMYTSDVTTPIVNLGIDGQFYTKGGYAPRRARIVATVQDQNGVYLSSKFITVIRDNDSSDAVQKRLTIPKATTNANSVGIAYDEEFSVGTHEVSFILHDANLNTLRTEKMVFVVQNDFGLKVYGNFPNPFKDQTDIAYEIIGGEPASVLEIKIYTVAGRLIKTFNDQTGKVTGFTDKISSGESRRVGLHVYTWDGTDESGSTVAYGVYYCRIRANFQGKEKDEILKIARIR